MGPGFLHPGNTRHADPRNMLYVLQWGPGFYTREIVETTLDAVVFESASMGPGFLHPGNVPCPRPRRARPLRFNGARVFTPGKCERWAGA